MMKRGLIVLALAGWMGTACALAQSNPKNSATDPYYGSVQVVAATPDVKQLSIDDAIQLGIQNNLALTEARQSQQTAQAQASQTLNLLLPNLDVSGGTGIHQYNLEAQGFRPGLLGSFASLIPPSEAASFPFIVKVDLTEGNANLSQTLFNWAGWDLYRARKVGAKAAYYNAQSTRGFVVLNVGTTYLQAIADSAQLDYARALLKTDETLLSQAVAEHQAGTGTAANLDELRARVEYQTQQQAVISAENTLEKDEITLKRRSGWTRRRRFN